MTPGVVGMSGLRHYTEMTWKHLLMHGIDVRAFSAGRGTHPGSRARHIPLPLRVLQASWRVAQWPSAEAITGLVDVVHSLDLMPPPTRRPLVVTVMDVLALTHPQFFAPGVQAAQRAHLDGARRADVVVTGCAATAGDIAAATGIPGERIVVTPYGRLAPAHSVALLDNEVGEPYLLSVSTIEPRKGYDVLAAAAALIPDCPRILVAGPDGFQGEAIRRQVAAADARRRVRFLGDVRDPARLVSLYRHALLVVQPTRAEGFGFPLLEAMGQGCAVVSSDIPQAREIAGEAARLVPVGDVEALADAVQQLLTDDAERASLAIAAAARAEPMTWGRTTEHLVGAYSKALG